MKKICGSKIDLHMHSCISDGTDTPEELISKVRAAGIELFSLTDHDAVKGCGIIRELLKEDDPQFITGVEFSCKDEEGHYHILGYGCDPEAQAVRDIVAQGHRLRMEKLTKRLDFLKTEFGITFSDSDRSRLYALENPGKPHIGNLMVKYGFAPTREAAIRNYLNKYHAGDAYVRPEEAVKAVLGGGGIPVLAHPSYGRGDELIAGDDMDRRLRRLISYGLQGVEAFYSGLTPKLQNEMLSFAEQYALYVTAGSDYHGKNKPVQLGDNHLPAPAEYPEGLCLFLNAVLNGCVHPVRAKRKG